MDIALLEGERWWGGAVVDGEAMPFGAVRHHRDLAVSARFGMTAGGFGGDSQSAPLLLSNRGRVVWSEQPFRFDFNDQQLHLQGPGALVSAKPGHDLGEAFRFAARSYFTPTGRMPATAMFTAPQYNTWIEMPYRPTQQGVLEYVHDLLAAGFPPGVVIIDDRWSLDYGTWRFDRIRFPDPSRLIAELHGLGCSVMLWLVPFISADSDTFRDVAARALLIRSADGSPAIRQWWNGYSAVLDATNPDAVTWLHDQLDALIQDHGVDGFKFDGGDLWTYRAEDLVAGLAEPAEPAEQSQSWAEVGLRYSFTEYRACWKMGGQPLAQRLLDKPPTWEAGGLASLIPQAIAQGLIGHPFICPDMIGGGELEAFRSDGYALDQELFVRYAQCAALFPMMQFSASPARVLDPRHLRACLDAIELRQQVLPDLLRLANQAAITGEPILRPLAYHFAGYEQVRDQFLIGPDILAAPVLEPATTTRSVILPPGRWQDTNGTTTIGPSTVSVDVALDTVPLYRLNRL